ncbi:aldo/keto reductase [Ahrensia marina]|uniref:aldo/keto reductase n=1 Tax=Ahrensia marina TaxID=1514904 RepID=UPI0035D0D927
MREFQRLGWTIPPLGIGTFAMGGTALAGGTQKGWPGVDPAEARRGMEVVLDGGIGLIDTADVYGAGHAEMELGDLLGARREKVLLATKFGKRMNEHTRERLPGDVVDADDVVAACEGSLRRLKTDRIDLYQLHINALDPAISDGIQAALERLVEDGKIRAYGWSTDSVACAETWTGSPRFGAVQMRLNVFDGVQDLLAMAEREGLAVLCREPLAQGILTGKYGASSQLAEGDVRKTKWNLTEGREARRLATYEALREWLTIGGRTPVQGALGWLMARSPNTLPIPGFKTEVQVRDILGALEHGPLPQQAMDEIAAIMAAHTDNHQDPS